MKKLRRYQRKGVRVIQKYDGVILQADEMGLGKTAQCLAWCRSRPDVWPVLVVCPANAKYVWEREAQDWFGECPMVIEGNYKRGRNDLLHMGNIVVINYDVLASWAPALKKVKFKTLMMDEGHSIANLETKRFKAVQDIALRKTGTGKRKTWVPRIPHRISISGTPLTNKPADLWATLHILWPMKFKTPWRYYWEFCKPFKMRNRWVFTGAKNLPKLHRMLKRLGMLRRTKAKKLKSLQPKSRHIVHIKLPDMREYHKAEANFLHWLSKKSLRKAKRAARAEAMVRMGYLLRMSVKLKMPFIARRIDRFLDTTDKKLVVFSYCSPLLRVLERRYGVEAVRIDGSVSGRKRMALVDRFQDKKSFCRVALCHGKAAGVALTLTAASDALGTDFPWSPAILMQAEARIHRFGQTKKCTMTYLVALDTMEEHVLETLIEKQGIMEQVIDGKVGPDSQELENLNKSFGSILLTKLTEGKT
jgi:SWI/SNF-related matrix-associated actin-dependent regulator 1 of chromatin subfamily A